jgi:hypothetical protein
MHRTQVKYPASYLRYIQLCHGTWGRYLYSCIYFGVRHLRARYRVHVLNLVWHGGYRQGARTIYVLWPDVGVGGWSGGQ